MQTAAFFSLTLVIVGILVFVVWRLASRRQSLPCPVWLRWLVELDNPFTRTNRAATIIDHLDLQPGMNILDAGCGPGRLSIPLARKTGPDGLVVAMDLQAGMLRRAKIKAQTAGLDNISFVHAGIGENKAGTNQFDRAVLVSVLGEIPDRKAALGEIYAALKPEGLLSISEIIFDPHFQSRKTVSRLAAEIGFHEHGFFGNRLAYTLNLEKPKNLNQVFPKTQEKWN